MGKKSKRTSPSLFECPAIIGSKVHYLVSPKLC